MAPWLTKRFTKNELNNTIYNDDSDVSELVANTEQSVSDPSKEMIIVFTTFGSIIDTAYNLIEEKKVVVNAVNKGESEIKDVKILNELVNKLINK